MFDETFWSSALANLFATVIGITIGLPLALWIDRIARARNEREKSKEAEQRAGKILTLLNSELKYNYEALDKFHQDVSNNFFPVRTESWDSFSHGRELQWINDPELLHHLSDAYAEINHFAFIFDKYVDADLLLKSVGAPELKERILQRVLRARITTLNQIKSTQSFIKKKLEQ
jgi:hypothetical protein